MTQAAVGFHCPECARSGAQKVVRARDLSGRPPLVTALIAINVVVFVAQEVLATAPSGGLAFWGLMYGPAVRDGEWWRVVSSGFLHASLLHLLMNMWALWVFGPPLERGVGSIRFAFIYAAGLLGGALGVSLFDFASPTLGASGAVLGLAGGLVAVLMRRGVSLSQTSLGGVILINLMLPLLVGRISFWGHAGGVAAGFAAGWLLSLLAERGGPDRRGGADSVTIAAGAALCMALFVGAVAGPIAFGH